MTRPVARRPNILLILSDQHSPHLAGFAGNRVIDTRALDGLAGRGARFESATCQSPLCVPSRMSLITGKYPHRCGAWDNGSVLAAGHQTLPGWLAKHDYATAAVGKMHFRGHEQLHGFAHRPYGDLVESHITPHQPDPPDTADGRSSDHTVGRFPFAGASAIPESLHADTAVTLESLAWALEFAAAHPATPWFMCASYFRPHFPLTAPGRYLRSYLERELPRPYPPAEDFETMHPHDRFIVEDFGLDRFSAEEHRHALAAYYASVDYVDDRIGELLTGLERSGLLEDTFVVYSSDHGELAGEHGLWWKRSYYRASTGVPLLIAGPGVEPGSRIEAPVELVDLFPTLCDWAGIEPPAGLDGDSLVPLLEGRPERRRKQYALSELLGGAPETRFRMVRDRRWKLVDFPEASPRLFDLVGDPGETRDLAAAPAAAPTEALQTILERGGDWAQLERAQERDRERRAPLEPRSRAALHYRLADGRIIDADDHLYDGSSVEPEWATT